MGPLLPWRPSSRRQLTTRERNLRQQRGQVEMPSSLPHGIVLEFYYFRPVISYSARTRFYCSYRGATKTRPPEERRTAELSWVKRC